MDTLLKIKQNKNANYSRTTFNSPQLLNYSSSLCSIFKSFPDLSLFQLINHLITQLLSRSIWLHILVACWVFMRLSRNLINIHDGYKLEKLFLHYLAYKSNFHCAYGIFHLYVHSFRKGVPENCYYSTRSWRHFRHFYGNLLWHSRIIFLRYFKLQTY